MLRNRLAVHPKLVHQADEAWVGPVIEHDETGVDSASVVLYGFTSFMRSSQILRVIDLKNEEHLSLVPVATKRLQKEFVHRLHKLHVESVATE